MDKISQVELAAAIAEIRPSWINNIDDIKEYELSLDTINLTLIPLAMSQSHQSWPSEYEVIIDENSYESDYEGDTGYLESAIRIVSDDGYKEHIIKVKDSELDDSNSAISILAQSVVDVIEYDEERAQSKWDDDGWNDDNDDRDY